MLNNTVNKEECTIFQRRYADRSIGSVTHSELTIHFSNLLNVRRLSKSTVKTAHMILHQIFDMAVMDQVVRTDPTHNVLKKATGSQTKRPKQKHCLTVPEQAALTEFLSSKKKYRHWYNIVTVALGTGMRIGEIGALTWEDCDFERREIHIRRTLTRYRDGDGVYKYHLGDAKTEAGKRIIPMLKEVRLALLDERSSQLSNASVCNPVDGETGFVFLSKHGNPICGNTFDCSLACIRETYNRSVLSDPKRQKSAILLPPISAHTLRHTFCTRYCEVEPNIKVVQHIMGHTDASVPEDVYNEATREVISDSFGSMESKRKTAEKSTFAGCRKRKSFTVILPQTIKE